MHAPRTAEEHAEGVMAEIRPAAAHLPVLFADIGIRHVAARKRLIPDCRQLRDIAAQVAGNKEGDIAGIGAHGRHDLIPLVARIRHAVPPFVTPAVFQTVRPARASFSHSSRSAVAWRQRQ